MADADNKRLLFRAYDVTSTSLIYGLLSDLIQGSGYVKTSGSSTTVSELNSTDNVFQGYANGDVLYVNVDGTWAARTITDAALAPDSVVVDSAVNWQNGTAGRMHYVRHFTSGTTASDGWFPVSSDEDKSVEVSVDTINATSIDVSIEGRINGGTKAVLYAKNYTAAGADVFVIPENVTEMRVGFQVNTDAGVQSVSATYKGREKGSSY